ncbi:MAG: hypothetical protein JXB15_15120 [Anaerolineales bacterium]|nr:hypothetical protein [Anaerolineales bacterium]
MDGFPGKQNSERGILPKNPPGGIDPALRAVSRHLCRVMRDKIPRYDPRRGLLSPLGFKPGAGTPSPPRWAAITRFSAFSVSAPEFIRRGCRQTPRRGGTSCQMEFLAHAMRPYTPCPP